MDKITLKTDGLCIAIPAEYSKAIGLNENDNIDISLNNKRNKIIICKSTPTCFICDTIYRLITVKDKHICFDCKERLVSASAGDCFY